MSIGKGMNQLVNQNPLMQVFTLNSKEYITSQWLHAEYRNNDGDKYSQLKDFNRLIRSIEAYPSYILSGDIVEIKSGKDIPTEAQNLRFAYESNNYANLMLISATMQLAISHHLDDEISKTISVAVNAKATQSKLENKPMKLKEVASEFKAAIVMAKLTGLTGNQMLLSADHATKAVTGYSPLALLGTNLPAPVKSQTLTPTEIGAKLGDNISAQTVNKVLEGNGFQVKIGDKWEPTEKGKPFGEMIDTTKRHSDGSPVKQWKWFTSIINEIN